MPRFGKPSYMLISLLAVMGMLLAACGGSGSTTTGTDNKPAGKTVALVTDIGGLNDQGYNFLSNAGYEKAREKYGYKKALIESKNESEYISNLTRAAQSSDLVIGVGFLMASAVDTVAKANPGKKFALIDACPTDAKGNCETLPNVAPLFFKEEQAGCLVGAAAGQLELLGKEKAPKLLGNNTIGAVGGIEIPPVVRYIAGYKYCAEKVNPKVKVVVNYANSFDDVAKCKDAATTQINNNKADIIFQVAGGCGVGALQVADEKGVYSIGVDKDQISVNKSVITSAVKKVDEAVFQTIETFQAGKFTNTPPSFDLKGDGVGYGTFATDIPAEAKATADQYAADIKAGKITVPEKVQ